MIRINSRQTYCLQFLVISGLLLFSLYLQFYQGVLPCPLCSLQRVTFVIIGSLSLITGIIYRCRIARILLNIFSFIAAILGIILAGRQIWLQHFPPAGNAECSPDLHYMIQVLPMNELIQKIFAGSAECADQSWQFLSINMAEWSLICFILLGLLSLYLLLQDIFKK